MVYKHRTIRAHHVLGAGAIASLLGVYHFASDNGLLGLVGYPRVATKGAPTNPTSQGGGQSNVSSNYGATNDIIPNGIPTSYNASSPPSQYQQPGSQYQTNANNQSYYPSAAPNPFNAAGDIRVYFSPAGGCTEAIVQEINQAQKQILIQAYSFTSEPIAAACVAAHRRGVAVFAILDKSQESEKYTAATFLVNEGIPTLVDSKHQIAHNKIILIDGRTIITGSFNFTTNAEKNNAENLLIFHDRPDLYSRYEANLKHHYEHSQPYSHKQSDPAAHPGNHY